MFSQVRRFIGEMEAVTEPNFKPSIQQYLEMLFMVARHGISPTEYYIYRLGAKDAKLDKFLLPPRNQRKRSTQNKNPWELVLKDKILFHLHMTRHNIPVPDIYGVFHSQSGYTREGGSLKTVDDLERLLRTLVSRDLVVKEIGGTNLLKVKVGPGGKVFTPREVFTRHLVDSLPHFLLEDCLANHAKVKIFNSSSLNACRVLTFVNKEGMCRVLNATIHFGRIGSATDSWKRGGVAAGVNLDTGQLGEGLVLPRFGGKWLKGHPDSKLPFQGFKIPMWGEILNLVTRAAMTIPWCNLVVWSIAITPQGPVMLKGNGGFPYWGQALAGGVLTPELKRELTELGNGPA